MQDGDVAVDLTLDGESFFFGEWPDDVDKPLEEIAEAEGFGSHLHASGLDFGEVEEVVDEVEEMSSAGADVLDVAGGFGVARRAGFAEEVGEAEDGVEGCSEFVADVGEELAFEAVGLIEGKVAFREFSELEVEAFVDGPELVLAGLQVSEHFIECLGQFLELIAGADVGADVQIAFADFFGGFAEDANGSEDEASGNEIEDDDGEGSGEDARDEDEDAIEVDLVVVDLVGDFDSDDAEDGGFSRGRGGSSGQMGGMAGEAVLSSEKRPGIAVGCWPFFVLLGSDVGAGVLLVPEAIERSGLEASEVGRGFAEEHELHASVLEDGFDGGDGCGGGSGRSSGRWELFSLGFAGQVLGFGAFGDAFSDAFVDLIHELFHALPEDEQGRADDEDHGGAEEQLALSGQGDLQLAGAFEHGLAIVCPELLLWNLRGVWYDR